MKDSNCIIPSLRGALAADIDGYDLSLALYWILESRTVLRTQIDACQHGKVVRQVVTTKDLREMCQNGVTLEDLRRLYGVDATLEDLELALPSLLIGDLGILPCSEEAIQGLSECQEESQDAMEEEVSPGQNANEEDFSALYDKKGEEMINNREDKRGEMTINLDKNEEDMANNLDENGKQVSTSLVDMSKAALPLLSSMDQQPVAKEMKAEVPSYYNPLLYTVPWYPLLALYLLSQSSNALDVLISLEILSHLI